MLLQFALGGLTIAVIAYLIAYVQNKDIKMEWWSWLLTILGLLYTVFVLEVFFDFFRAGEPQAALVIGGMMAVVSVIWGVLLARFVFLNKTA